MTPPLATVADARPALAGAVAVALLVVGVRRGRRRRRRHPPLPAATSSSGAAAKVTFLELGADKCVPCKEMRPVMEGIEQAFGDQVEVIFYDVWDDPAPANEYGIQMIPTQIFLDENGEEFHRHTGFYPQADIEALLVERGLEKLATQ